MHAPARLVALAVAAAAVAVAGGGCRVYLAPPPTGGPYSLNFDVESSELSSIPTQAKPLWLGEFGTFRSLYANAAAAAPPLKQHKDALKARGFAAWSFWSWDISRGTQFSTFDAVEQGGAIDAVRTPRTTGSSGF